MTPEQEAKAKANMAKAYKEILGIEYDVDPEVVWEWFNRVLAKVDCKLDDEGKIVSTYP